MAQQWYCRSGEKVHGPFSSKDLKRLADAGKLRPESLIRRESDKSWMKANRVKGLFAEGAAAAAPKPAATKKPAPAAKPPRPGKKESSTAKPATGKAAEIGSLLDSPDLEEVRLAPSPLRPDTNKPDSAPADLSELDLSKPKKLSSKLAGLDSLPELSKPDDLDGLGLAPMPGADDADDEFTLAPLATPKAAEPPRPAAPLTPSAAKSKEKKSKGKKSKDKAAAKSSGDKPPASEKPKSRSGPTSALAQDGLNFTRVIMTGITAVVLSFAALCFSLVPILSLLLAVAGFIFAVRALGLSKGDRNAVGVSLVAMLISVAGFGWGLKTTVSAEDPVLRLQVLFGKAEDKTFNPDNYLDAAVSAAVLNEIDVQVSQVGIGKIPGVNNSKDYLLVTLLLTNTSKKKVDYHSWGHAKGGAKVVDTQVNDYFLVENPNIQGQLKELDSLYPGDRKSDLMVFQQPVEDFNELWLTLPGKAVGSEMDVLFKIPRDMVSKIQRAPPVTRKTAGQDPTSEIGPE